MKASKYSVTLIWGRTQKNILYLLLGAVLTGKILSPEFSFELVDYVIMIFGIGFLVFEFVIHFNFILEQIKMEKKKWKKQK